MSSKTVMNLSSQKKKIEKAKVVKEIGMKMFVNDL